MDKSNTEKLYNRPYLFLIYDTSSIKIPSTLHHYNMIIKLSLGCLRQCNISPNLIIRASPNAQNFSEFYISMNLNILQIIRRLHISHFLRKAVTLTGISPPKLIQVYSTSILTEGTISLSEYSNTRMYEITIPTYDQLQFW